jgi:hypothetical protein
MNRLVQLVSYPPNIVREINAALKDQQRWRLAVLAVVFVAGLTYVGGLDNGFVDQDFAMMALSTLDFGTFCKRVTAATRVKPFPLVLNWVVYRAFGMNPVGYHLLVLMFHTLCTVLVFHIGRSVSGNKFVGLVAALVFAVYPRHHETVLWLAADQFVIVSLFAVAGLLLFRTYLQTTRLRYQLGTLGCVCIALLSHEVGATLFPLLFLMEFILWRPPQERWQALRRPTTYGKYVPYLVLFALYFALMFGGDRLLKLSTDLSVQDRERLRHMTYHLTGVGINEAKNFAAYLTYAAYPQIPLRSLDPDPVTAAVAFITGLVLLFLLVKGTPLVRFAVLWIFLTLAPFVFFVPFGNADRYFYMSAVGFSILAGVLGCWGYDRLKVRSATWARTTAVLLMGMYLVSSVTLIQQRSDEWRRAGEIAADVVEQVKHLHPSVPPESTMLFVALPDRYKQASVFWGGGVGGAVYLAYGAQPSAPGAYRTRDPAVISYLKEAEPVDHPLPGLYVFLYENGILYDKSDVVSDLGPLGGSTWSR